MAAKIINIPDLGEAEDVEVIEVCAKVGDQVDSEDPIIVLESDKAAMEIPASVIGKVISIEVSLGDTVTTGSPFLKIEVSEDAEHQAEEDSHEDKDEEKQTLSEQKEPSESEQLSNAEMQRTPPVTTKINNEHIYAGPAVRKLAREFGIDLSIVQPTGPKNRIQKEDLHRFVRSRLSATPQDNGFQFSQPDFDYSKWGPTKEERLSKFQKSSLANLHTSWINIPHVTQHDEVDINAIEKIRLEMKEEAKKKDIRLTLLSFVIKAVTQALQKFPDFNASISENQEDLVHKKYYNIGFAANTPRGLLVPVVKNADQKNILTIAKELGDLSAVARDGKIKLEAMQGGTFTVSSLGGFGGTGFTPIINAPEVAILGISKAKVKPVHINGQFLPRLILPLSLSYDHRVADGVAGIQFTSLLKSLLEDPETLIGKSESIND